MKNKLIIFVVIITCIAAGYYAYRKQLIISVDFDISMQKDNYVSILDSTWGLPIYSKFKVLYELNRPDKVTYHESVLIPRKLHQIWLGSPLPEEFAHLSKTFKNYMPDWEYKLWTDADLALYPMHNRQLYDAAINYGEKADIARYEILYNEGGVYVDTDYECLQSLEPLNHYYEFYIGIQPLDTNIVQLGIGLIGSAPGHPILRSAIANLALQSTKTKQIIIKTGPIYFTHIFYQIIDQLAAHPIIALPATYFYPRGYTQSLDDRKLWLKPESYAVHHWAASWRKPEGFVHK